MAYEGMQVDNDEEDDRPEEFVWDDVNDMELPIDMEKNASAEEMGHVQGDSFKVVKKSEAWAATGKPPLSTQWVDTDNTHGTGAPLLRLRMGDLFSPTSLVELMRFMLLRQAM